MSDANNDLRRLQDALDAVRPERVSMFVPEIDGYVAALIVCPETVEPSEWLPGIWGWDRAFSDGVGAEAAIAAVMDYYNRTAELLASFPEEYAPVLQIDYTTGEPMWDMWIDGFERAMQLRPDSWQEIALSGDEAASASVCTILALSEICCGRSELTEEAENALDRLAPGLIPEFVANLYAWSQSREMDRRAARAAGFPNGARGDGPPDFGRKMERNELCPCGSGRKYSRCCGAN